VEENQGVTSASPCIVGDYWLDKRRDGLASDIWQIATYVGKSRSVVYRSTKCRTLDLDPARDRLRAHEAAARSKDRGQSAESAQLLPHLFNYLREHGPDVKRLDTVKSSFRVWIGFLQQDELTTGATVADMTKGTVARFRRWRMAEHAYEVEWGDKVYRRTSQGVTGEAVQRNIEDLRAALYHAEAEKRIIAPKIPSVDKKLRSDPRNIVLTTKQLGAMWGYAREDTGAWRWIALMMGTAARPGAALAFDPATQWIDEILDLHPEGADRTDKRNAVVPAIGPLQAILTAWKAKPHEVVKSRKTWWRTMRRVLDVPRNVDPYAIRHTVSTFMDAEGVPGAELSAITGHIPSHRGLAKTTSKHYLHYDPRNCPKARRALTKLFKMVQAESDRWSADHLRTIPVRGKPIALTRNASTS
jgi:hypothetical protein